MDNSNSLKHMIDICIENNQFEPTVISLWHLHISTEDPRLKIQSLKEIIILIINYKGHIDESCLLFISPKPPDKLLTLVLVELSRSNEWAAIGHLILGLFPNKSALCGAAKNCSTAGVSVVPLLTRYLGKSKYWVDKLAATIIKNGSSIDQLWKIFHQPPIHTSAEIAVQSGFFELYTEVANLSHQHGHLDIRNEEGITVIEYLRKKDYHLNPNFKRIFDIYQQIKGMSYDEANSKAKKAFQDGNYDEALQCYFHILQSLDKDDVKERAKYFRNISLTYTKQKNYELSLEFAEQCLSIDSTFGKAYWRKAQVLQILERPHLACHTYLTGLAYSDNPLEFFSEAIKQLENNIDHQNKYNFKECFPLFQNVESSLWSEFFCQAAINGKWKSIKLLLLSPENDMALVKSFDASNVSLSTLLDSIKSEESLKKSCHKILLILLKNGASIFSLSSKPGDAFHILVKIVLITESTNIFEYVLKRHPLTMTPQDKLLLHTAIKNGNVNSGCCFRLVRMLLQQGMDPKFTDTSGKTPSDYITEEYTITGSLLEIYTPGLELESASLTLKGDELFAQKKHKLSLHYYKVALAVLGNQKKTSALQSTLQTKCQECLLHIYAINDIFEGISNYRIKKIKHMRNKNMSSLQIYFDESITEIIKDICNDIDRGNYDLPVKSLQELIYITINLIKTRKFDKAMFACEKVLRYKSFPILDKNIDISCFCTEEAINAGNENFECFLIILIDAGVNLQNLSVYQGDTYLHAASILACRSAYFRLLDFILVYRTRYNAEINLIDDKGKTALFRVLNEPNTAFKKAVVDLLMSHGAEWNTSYSSFPEKRLPAGVHLNIHGNLVDVNSKKKNSRSAPKHLSKSPLPAKSSIEKPPVTEDPCAYCQKCFNCALRKKESDTDTNTIFESLVELCQLKHEGKQHNKWVKKSIDLIVDHLQPSEMLVIPACLFALKTDLFLKIVLKFASLKKWRCMYQAFVSYQKKHKSNCLENFARTLTVANFLNSISFEGQVNIHEDILTCLIDNGATLKKDPQLNKTALEVCIANQQYRAIIILLKKNLRPSLLTLSPGDTPLHAAADIALCKDVGYFDLFKYLLNLHDSNPKKYPYLKIDCVDKNQRSLYHLACQVKYTDHSLKLVQILHKRRLPSNVPDKAGKIPYQYISRKPDDRRRDYLTRASSETVQTITPSNQSQPAPEPEKPEVQKEKAELPVEAEPPVESGEAKKVVHRETSIREQLKEMVKEVTDHKCRELHVVAVRKEKTKDQVDNYQTDEAKGSVTNSEDVNESSGSETEEYESVDLSSGVFEKLEWEVECTSDVWKILHAQNVPCKKRKLAISRIQQLASGDWHRTNYKKVKDIPQTLKLFTIKLSRSSRIVWELAIAFSPRCSDIKRESDGQIYSEVIRVWAVVFNMKYFKHVLEQIIKSHQRGERCLMQKPLKSINDQQACSNDGKKRLPRLFTGNQIEDHLLDVHHFHPPASDRDDEYHIIKFYSFSTALVSSALQMDPSQSIDFPFQVTEREHQIINLGSGTPIILLGRSGTGKTTCCLYRLWVNFVNYWSRANLADGPLYPVNSFEIKFSEVENDPQENDDSEDVDESNNASDKMKDRHQTTENQATAFPENAPQCSNNNMDGLAAYTHLHQLFVTKNGVLCTEVLKNFQELCRGSELANKYVTPEKPSLLYKFEEITDNHFPLFLTSKKLWMILDASLDPPYFFQRTKDGSLKTEVIGWSNDDDHLDFLPDYDDIDDKDEYEGQALPYDCLTLVSRKNKDQKVEVTYEMFLQLWPEINKPMSGYHPSLIWTEIISFIKGSFEALNTEHGYLSQDQYISIGRKRAPNFTAEREKVYQLFSRYQKEKKKKKMFDECDVVFNLYKRLNKEKSLPCTFHEIYVDETQDFTQAELCLLIQLSENPNHMFLTGDTAQNIMRGVSFRFSDLKTLFFYAKEQSVLAKRGQTIQCPKSLYKLFHNYRSHQGILKLASSIIDILFRYFSDSFDPMEKDQGLFDGPKPKLLESCNIVDLALLLSKDKRQASHIEFGAHQVILVVNNESRKNLPEKLSTALVLTIFEAKGLEFDDVLLYNFFHDSQASKEWRVVTDYLLELGNEQKTNESTSQSGLSKINMDQFQQAYRPRPLAFNSEQHKILNSELKLLYTAITRARVNLWIFDEDIEMRAPMFDYFKTLELVETINTDKMEGKGIAELIFAEKSSPEMWLHRGYDFNRKFKYEIAAKCYQLGGHKELEKLALANHQAQLAQRCPEGPKKKENFLQAARLYIDCNQHVRAARCLEYAKEKLLSTILLEKCQEYKTAARNYLILQDPLKASQCFEILQQFDRAVDILHDNKMYDRAINVIQRYNILFESYGKNSEDIPDILLKHKPLKDLNYLCYQSADLYYKDKKYDKMKNVLQQLPSTERMEFLEKKGLIDLAADMLFEEGLLEETIQLLCRNGHYQKCIKLARSGTPEMLANCLYTFAQFKYIQFRQSDESSDLPALQNELQDLLEEAKACYQRIDDMNGYSLCLLLLSRITKDRKCAAEALEGFLQISPQPNVAGCLETAYLLIDYIQIEENYHTSNIERSLQLGYKFVKDLKSAAFTVSLQLREYLQYFGFHILNNETVCIYPKLEPLVTLQFENTLNITSFSQEYPLKEIKQKLHHHLLMVIEKLFLWVQMCYTFFLSQSIQCPQYTAGYECNKTEICQCPLQKLKIICKRPGSGCLHRHEPYNETAFSDALIFTIKLMTMDSDVDQCVSEDELAFMVNLEKILNKKNPFEKSQLLLKILTPVSGNGFSFKISRQFRSIKKWLISQPKCYAFVRNHLFATWKRVMLKNRKLPEFFLDSQILIGLFNLKVRQNIWMNKLCMFKSSVLVSKGLDKSVLVFARNMPFCIYERFLDSLYFLHVKSDPFESLIKFTKYTTLLHHKKYFPCLDILLFWCEYFFLLALMLLLKNDENLSVALPESYVHQSFFIDCLKKHSFFSLQKAIQETRPFHRMKVKTLQNRIEKLVTLMFQSNSITDETHVTSGVTERYIILGLVFLSNTGRGVYQHLGPKILESILKIGIMETMAPRLKNALCKLSQAKGNKDTVMILNELLSNKGDALGMYFWSYNYQTSQGLQCGFRTLSAPTSLSSPELNSTKTDEGQDDDVECDPNNETEDESVLSETEKMQASKAQKEIKAISIISRAYLAYKFRCSCRNLVNKLSECIARESGNEVDYFSDIKLSETCCNICGQSFTAQSTMSLKMLLNEQEEEPSSPISEDAPKISEMDKHKEKSSHVEKSIQFRRCVKNYRRDFVPVLKKAQEILSNSEQEDSETAYSLNQLNKCFTCLDQATSELCKKATWTKLSSLQTKLTQLKDAVENVQQKLLQKQRKIAARNNAVASALEDEELDDFDDTEDIVQETSYSQILKKKETLKTLTFLFKTHTCTHVH